MKKIAILLFISLSLFGCKKEATQPTVRELKNCRTVYLDFNDDITLSFATAYTMDLKSDGMCSYEYNGQDMKKLTGGFIVVPTGANFSHTIFVDSVYDSICHLGNDIYVYKKYLPFGGVVPSEKDPPLIFSLNSVGQLLKVAKFIPYSQSYEELYFSYSPNLITETDGNGRTRRKFYFTNNNLVKVESDFYSGGELYSRQETLFDGFDDKVNPFKNKYYIKGAFFRAFSQNNYTRLTRNYYTKAQDGTMVLTGNFHTEVPIKYDSNGYPMFGDYVE